MKNRLVFLILFFLMIIKSDVVFGKYDSKDFHESVNMDRAIRRNPSLEELDIQGVRLGMMAEKIHSILLNEGWKKYDFDPIENIYATRVTYEDNRTSKKTITITYAFLGNSVRGGAISIEYNQIFDKDVELDSQKIEELVISKYGQANSEHSFEKYIANVKYIFTDLIYYEYRNVPSFQKVVRTCQEYLMKQGVSPIVAAHKASSVVYPPDTNGIVPVEILKKLEDTCPTVLPMQKDILDSVLAPTLKVHIIPSEPGIKLEMSWTKPIYEFNRHYTNEESKKRKKKIIVDNVDL